MINDQIPGGIRVHLNWTNVEISWIKVDSNVSVQDLPVCQNLLWQVGSYVPFYIPQFGRPEQLSKL